MRTVKVRILPPQPIFSFKNSVGGVGCFYSSCRTAVCRRNPCFQSEALVFGQIPHANASKSRSLVSAIQSACFAISLDVRDFGAQTSPVPISQDCQTQGLRAPCPPETQRSIPEDHHARYERTHLPFICALQKSSGVSAGVASRASLSGALPGGRHFCRRAGIRSKRQYGFRHKLDQWRSLPATAKRAFHSRVVAKSFPPSGRRKRLPHRGSSGATWN